MKMTFGILGLGVMGKSLALNFANKGISLSLYNRYVAIYEENVASEFIKSHKALTNCLGFENIKDFVLSIERPRKILIMVNAGNAIDTVINELINYLEKDDIIIDGGNSHYKKTNFRNTLVASKGIHFIGMGVSGGEKGALIGPALMPGGNKNAYKKIEPFLQKIAAKDFNNNPCCKFLGKEGSGHFVKMIHNGIEYAEMQIIAEIYSILRFGCGMPPNEIASIFKQWNKGKLKNYLLEITSHILEKKEGDVFLIDYILDKSSHKGTGSWTTVAAAELGVPFTMSSAALNARYISALKDFRVLLAKNYTFTKTTSSKININTLKNAYQVARIINHHQGLEVIKTASQAYGWSINLANVLSVWTNGCIIASDLVKELLYVVNKNENILISDSIFEFIKDAYADLKNTLHYAIDANIASPCLLESLNYINGITKANGVGNIIQAQRDCFGAHTYKRIDDPDGASHHTNWID